MLVLYERWGKASVHPYRGSIGVFVFHEFGLKQGCGWTPQIISISDPDRSVTINHQTGEPCFSATGRERMNGRTIITFNFNNNSPVVLKIERNYDLVCLFVCLFICLFVYSFYWGGQPDWKRIDDWGGNSAERWVVHPTKFWCLRRLLKQFPFNLQQNHPASNSGRVVLKKRSELQTWIKSQGSVMNAYFPPALPTFTHSKYPF